jgi:radical SAM superfamily enzyme YgiQ (UPF0313 family)
VPGDVAKTQWRASRALLVAVDITGVVIPHYGDHPKLPMTLGDLRFLERLHAEPPAAASESRPPPGFLDALMERGLVLEGDHPVGPTTAPTSWLPEEPVSSAAPSTGRAATSMLVLPNPLLLRYHDGRFECASHNGEVRLRMTAPELLALARFRLASEPMAAYAEHRTELGDEALPQAAFDELVRNALGTHVLAPFDPDQGDGDRQAHQAEVMRQGMRAKAGVTAAFDRLEAKADEHAGRADRVRVIGVHTNWASAPAGLGMVLAHAKAFENGMLQESYDFRPRLVWDEALLRGVDRPSVYLFSNYVWSSDENLRLSALAKQINPHNITIHGGPDTPKYGPDVEQYFREHDHVDIAVHGEGEETFAHLLAALRGHVGDGPADLTPLEAVAGLTYRRRGTVVTTGPRDRIADLNIVPSPILTGLFDGFIPAGPLGGVALETNRGCPYGCTFCDWGSATLSRVRKFDLDRIFAELEWCAENKILTVGIADANFGIFERDVEIAEKIAELKATFGYPKTIGNNYAKNTVKHLSKIIETFTTAGIVAEGKMSMQTFDDDTLLTIRRKNIKVERYDELSLEFRRNRLPLSVDLMLGLPGSTPETFRNDLQAVVDRDVRAIIHPTVLLPNSPMNEPEYRIENGIVARPGEEVHETSTYTSDEWHQMHRLGAGQWLFENFGILRQVATYVRAETGRREVDFYGSLIEASDADPESWPFTAIILRVLPHAMVPPVSWRFFLDEVRRRLVTVEGIVDDTALQTVLVVQHSLLPARDRRFPVEVPLAHDYVAWRSSVVDARDGDHPDWPTSVHPLRTFAPGVLTVDDPNQICTDALDGSITAIAHESAWDFDSPVSRPRQGSPDSLGARAEEPFEAAGAAR